MAKAVNPIDQTTRTLKFQGIDPSGETVSFVEHHTFDAGTDAERVEGITLFKLSVDQWRKDGAPFELTVTVSAKD